MIATYNDREAMKAMPEGLYLGLFHGRDNPDETLEDWGFDGPIIGPLEYVHTTYSTHIKLGFVEEERCKLYVDAGIVNDHGFTDLMIVEDMVQCQGKYYGDWTVFYHRPE